MKYYKYLHTTLSLIGDYDDREDAQVDANCVDPSWFFILTEEQLLAAREELEKTLPIPLNNPESAKFFTIEDNLLTFAGEYGSLHKAKQANRVNGSWVSVLKNKQAVNLFSEIDRLIAKNDIDLSDTEGPR